MEKWILMAALLFISLAYAIAKNDDQKDTSTVAPITTLNTTSSKDTSVKTDKGKNVVEMKNITAAANKSLTNDEDPSSEKKTNGTESTTWKDRIQDMRYRLSNNKNAVQITMFALIGLTSLVVLYFIVKTMRLKREKSKSRKYGVLTNGMEMDHLESDSDDEDTTVFELNHRR
ncbi:membrane protein FAM174-like [Symsagittifera roscoffensis]|uniref:membrane protein FAM174-like n=1 Tax=Symsagittifera roscoffensis TaxID=84072 RepID=UPI00307BD31E